MARWLDESGRAALYALTGEAPDVIGVLDLDLVIRDIDYTTGRFREDGVVGASVLELTPSQWTATRSRTHSTMVFPCWGERKAELSGASAFLASVELG